MLLRRVLQLGLAERPYLDGLRLHIVPEDVLQSVKL